MRPKTIEQLVKKDFKNRNSEDFKVQSEITHKITYGLSNKKSAELQQFVARQLEREDLSPAQRNILILLVSISYDMPKLSLSSSLPKHIASIDAVSEKPILFRAFELFSYSAASFQAEFFRQYLSEDNNSEVRNCALKGIQKIFRDIPPDIKDLNTILLELRNAVIVISSKNIPNSCELDGAFKGDLGEEPIYASAVLFDTNLPTYIEEYANTTTYEFDKYDPNDHGDLYIPQYLIMKGLRRIAKCWEECSEDDTSILENPVRRNVMKCVNILDEKVRQELHRLNLEK